MTPYIPVVQWYLAEKLRGLAQEQYIQEAVSLLEERLPREAYRLVADSDVLVLAVALATADSDVVEGIVDLVRKQIDACLAR